jgi:hypothetical protein
VFADCRQLRHAHCDPPKRRITLDHVAPIRNALSKTIFNEEFQLKCRRGQLDCLRNSLVDDSVRAKQLQTPNGSPEGGHDIIFGKIEKNRQKLTNKRDR